MSVSIHSYRDMSVRCYVETSDATSFVPCLLPLEALYTVLSIRLSHEKGNTARGLIRLNPQHSSITGVNVVSRSADLLWG